MTAKQAMGFIRSLLQEKETFLDQVKKSQEAGS
jgi:hypothetical protein